MIEISAMSQSDAIEESKTLKCRTAIISITGKYADDVIFDSSDKLVDVLHLHFDDYIFPEDGAMTYEDAEKIAQFLDNNLHKINRLIVHCGFGTSRSVGTAAAIVDLFRENDNERIRMPEVIGNKNCYRLVREALKKHFLGKVNNTCIIRWGKES